MPKLPLRRCHNLLQEFGQPLSSRSNVCFCLARGFVALPDLACFFLFQSFCRSYQATRLWLVVWFGCGCDAHSFAWMVLGSECDAWTRMSCLQATFLVYVYCVSLASHYLLKAFEGFTLKRLQQSNWEESKMRSCQTLIGVSFYLSFGGLKPQLLLVK